MFTQANINDVVSVLKAKKCDLYHACQLTDLRSYCEIGGIPSRALLARHGLPFTKFDTDGSDKTKQVWDKVFLNLTDYGTIFSQGKLGAPTSYGPIMFQLQPEVLLSATDVAICLRSAGANGFDRAAESLSTKEDVLKLFGRDGSVKYGDMLRDDFKSDSASSVEISCSFPGGDFPFRSLIHKVIVDPYVIKNYRLVDMVKQEFGKTLGHLEVHIESRSVNEKSGRRELYNELYKLIDNHGPNPDKWLSSGTATESLSSWLNTLQERNLMYQVRRYANYLQRGTLQPMKAHIQAKNLAESQRVYSYDEMARDWGYADWDEFSRERD